MHVHFSSPDFFFNRKLGNDRLTRNYFKGQLEQFLKMFHM